MQKTGLFFVMILLFGISPVFAEQYYYIDEVLLLASPPTFCAVRFSDANIPDADEKMYKFTRNAVLDWRTKLIDYTGNVQGWDFKYKLIYPLEDNDWNYQSLGCDVPIFFTTTYYFAEGERGVTEYYSDGYATVTISYVSASLDVKKLIDDPQLELDEYVITF